MSGGDAAVTAAAKYPKPLPLPPGVSIRDLAARLRNVEGPTEGEAARHAGVVSHIVSQIEETPPKGDSVGLSPFSKGFPYSPGSVDRGHCRDVLETQAEDQETSHEPEPEQSVASPEAEPARKGLHLAQGFADELLGSACTYLTSLESPYLWMDRSDQDLADDIEHTLYDFDTLIAECNALFEVCRRISVHTVEGQTLRGMPVLAIVTQALVDKLGSRSKETLEHIGCLFSAFIHTNGSLNRVEFQGYVAALLAKILRELRERSDQRAPCRELQWECNGAVE